MYSIKQIKRQFLSSVYNSFETQGAGLEGPEKKKSTVEKPEGDKLREISKLAKSIPDHRDAIKKQKDKIDAAEGKGTLSPESLGEKPKVSSEAGQEVLKEVLPSGKVGEILTSLPSGEGAIVVPDRVREQVKKSFEETPFDTEGLSEEEIRSEVQKRVVATKVEEMGTRELTPSTEGKPGETEADYIASLEEKYGLDNDALMSLRARNQAGIGGDIDTTGEITDPEAYKKQMEGLAQNAKKAQEYLAEYKDLIDAGNTTIAANAAAILEGKDIKTLTPQDNERLAGVVAQDASLGDGFSSLGRLAGSASKGFDSIGSGVGNINIDPSQLANLPSASLEKSRDLGQMFGSAIEKYGSQYGIPQEWANNPSLHKVVMKESGGIVGRLNYTFAAVAKRMGTSINDPKFVTFVHQKLQAGAKASDFGIRSTATGVGQCIRSNVLAYYPDKFQGIGDANNESIGMLRYIKARYKTPENVVAHYGKSHEGY